MIIVKDEKESFEELQKRGFKIAQEHGSCTMHYNGGYCTIEYSDTKPVESPQIRALICVKDYKSFKKGDKLNRSRDLWYTPDGRSITDDEIDLSYFEQEFTIA
jgi:hypothetical protein